MLTKADFVCFSTRTLINIINSSPQVQAEFANYLATAKAVFWLGAPFDFVKVFNQHLDVVDSEFAQRILESMDEYRLYFCPCEAGLIEAASRVISANGYDYTIEEGDQPTMAALYVKEDKVKPELRQSQLPLRMPGTKEYNIGRDRLTVSYYHEDGQGMQKYPSAEELFSAKRTQQPASRKPSFFADSSRVDVTEELPKTDVLECG